MMNIGNMYRFMGGFGYGLEGLISLFWMFLLVAGFIALIFWITKQNKLNSNQPNDLNNTTPKTTMTALDILKERYAKGELTKEQFDQMKKDIE